jgi:hypothetical protein
MTLLSSDLTLVTVKDGEDSSSIGSIFGTCKTLGDEKVKQVIIEQELEFVNGLQLSIKFSYKNDIEEPVLQLTYNEITVGEEYPIYSGTRLMTKNDIYNWQNGQVVNFIFYNDKWYITSASSANAMEFAEKDGYTALRIYNNTQEKGPIVELGNTQLDFKIGDKNLASYGTSGVEFFDATEDTNQPYAQFGGTTVLGYPDDNKPHLTAQNNYLAMNDEEGEYFRVSRKGLMYKATVGDNETQWLGINPNGGIGIITREEDDENSIKTFESTVKDGKDAIFVQITSSNGNIFRDYVSKKTVLTCTVYYGVTDVTEKVTKFIWKKYDKDGKLIETYDPTLHGRYLEVSSSDILVKAIFNCEIEIDL